MAEKRIGLNSIFIIFTGLLIAIGRLSLGTLVSETDISILLVMAIVNYVAFGFVLLFIGKDINRLCLEKINKAGLETSQKRNRRKIIIFLSIIYLILYFICGTSYILYLRSTSMNDAISIIALAVSIASDGITNSFSPVYYNFITKVESWNIKLISYFNKKGH